LIVEDNYTIATVDQALDVYNRALNRRTYMATCMGGTDRKSA
jgi:hypothetical protein